MFESDDEIRELDDLFDADVRPGEPSPPSRSSRKGGV